MTTQTQSGKSFEYALAISLYNKINNGQKISILKDKSYNNAKNFFKLCSKDEQEKFIKSSNAAIKHIVTLEPRLENPISDDDEIIISIQSDQMGMTGDIRDILIIRSNEWKMGFSAKNKNNAVKHSRLSDKIDFGHKWIGTKCSTEYMDTVKVIFGKVRKLVTESKTRKHDLLWCEIPTKIEEFYIPLLTAFEKELCRLIQNNPNAPFTLLEYLIGTNDFYKIMKYRKTVKIEGYNLHSTLNISSGKKKPLIRIPRLQFPTKIISITRKDNNKTIVVFDEGWQISFRIHNATSKAEPSLKFDVRLVGRPESLYSHDELW